MTLERHKSAERDERECWTEKEKRELGRVTWSGSEREQRKGVWKVGCYEGKLKKERDHEGKEWGEDWFLWMLGGKSDFRADIEWGEGGISKLVGW